MTNTICGHTRNVLTMALEDLAHMDNDIIVGLARLPAALPEWRGAVLDLIDPAKLAGMLVERGRMLGFAVYPRDLHIRPPFPCYGFTALKNGVYAARWIQYTANDFWRIYTMPQARALLLQWLRLPDGAREEAEQVLRGTR